MHCDRTVHVNADLIYGWIVESSRHPDTNACPPNVCRLFPLDPELTSRTDVKTRRDISKTVDDSG